MIAVGIEDIHFATGSYVLDLQELAIDLGVDPQKYRQGLGQEYMSVPAEDEDIVTMAAQAAAELIKNYPRERIRCLLLATETGIDQSKSAGIYVHKLLGLESSCRVVELKQACYSATMALQMACSHVRCNPQEKVLVVATDIARYELRSSAEATQGCGAVAFIVGNEPQVLRIEQAAGVYTEDVMDFWRPNYLSTALVDGKFSARVYLQALKACWRDIEKRWELKPEHFDAFCYHLPFTKMAVKAHSQVVSHLPAEQVHQHLEALEPSLLYSRQVGNCYSASLYLGLISLLEQSTRDLSNARLALFSYGSGCVAEIVSATIMPSYRQKLRPEQHQLQLSQRQKIDLLRYRTHFYALPPTDGSSVHYPKIGLGPYRLKAIQEHRRLYESNL